MRTIVIWGAGRIGRGFVADVFHEAGWRIVFVDIDKELVRRLNEAKAYTVFKAKQSGITRTRVEGGFTALNTDDVPALEKLFEEEGLLLDIAVHEPCLPCVADLVAPLLAHRAACGAGAMDILMNVNTASSDRLFARLLEERLTGPVRAYYIYNVGITGTFAMCISPFVTEEMLREDSLAVLNNGFAILSVGRRLLKGEVPAARRLRLSNDIQAEEMTKLYTLNMAHAVCCYLGVKAGCRKVIEVMRDECLRYKVTRALDEAITGLSHAYGYPAEYMDEWRVKVMEMLDNPYIDDDLARLGADTRRKLSQADRLCGPARLCIRAGGTPLVIAEAIRAGYEFEHEDEGTRFVRDMVRREGLPYTLSAISGLDQKEELYSLINI